MALVPIIWESSLDVHLIHDAANGRYHPGVAVVDGGTAVPVLVPESVVLK